MKYKITLLGTLALIVAAGGANITAVAEPPVNNFPMPKTVPVGTQVKIDGSNSMQAVNQGLKERFQKQFPGTDISLPGKYQGSDAGVQAVEAGKVDIASIGRSISKEEAAKGIAAKEIGRSKIAIIVKDNNPYQGNLTLTDFAKIYRGEVTDWSQLASAKGAKGKIKVIDRPNSSDTRRAFANYPVFQNGKLKTGSNVEKLTEDSTQAMVAKLGKDDIGYAPADQIKNVPGIRAVTLHGTQPDNPKYPFSQPLVYAYKNKDGKVAEGAKAFLGYASDPSGQTGIAESIATGVATSTATSAVEANPVKPAPTVNDVVVPSTADIPTDTTPITPKAGGLPWWWMLPVLAAGGGLLWFLNRKKPAETFARTSASYSVPTGKSTATIDRPSSGYIPTRESTGRVDIHRNTIDNLSPDLRQVYLAINHEPTNLESIVTHSHRSVEHVTDALHQLESMGLITHLPGRKYRHTH